MQSNLELVLNGTKATIDVENGGSLHSFSVKSSSEEKVLMKLHPGHRFENAWLFPFPNRLKGGEYSFENKKYQFPINDNDGLQNALHGFINDRKFTVLNQAKDYCELSYDYRGELAYYPFPCTINIRYELNEMGLNTEIEIVNKGTTNLPFGIGWHPYFHIESGTDSVKLKMPECNSIQLDSSGIPNGVEKPSHCFEDYLSLEKRHLDDCFRATFSGLNTTAIKFHTGEVLEIWQNAEYPFIQVYTHPERKSVAVEPMSCGVNAFNTGDGLSILAPGESRSFRAGIYLKI